MSGSLAASRVVADRYEAWDAAVADAIGGSAYSTSGYLDALCSVTGGTFELVGIFDDERLVGGIGLYVRKRNKRSYVRGRYLLYYNGPFVCRMAGASQQATEARIYAVNSAIEQWLRESSYDPVEIKPRSSILDCRPFLEQNWRAIPTYSYEVRLDRSDELFNSMDRNARRQVRQGEKARLRVELSEDVEQFHDWHSRTCARKGFPAYLERAAMKDYFTKLNAKALAELYVVSDPESGPSSGLLVLTGGHNTAHAVCAASRDDKLPPGANAFLRWKTFEALAGKGFSKIDLTDAHEMDVARFKRQLGAVLVVTQQLSLPQTAADQLQSAMGRAVSAGKSRLKRILRREGET